jgi:hypothetical protein
MAKFCQGFCQGFFWQTKSAYLQGFWGQNVMPRFLGEKVFIFCDPVSVTLPISIYARPREVNHRAKTDRYWKQILERVL